MTQLVLTLKGWLGSEAVAGEQREQALPTEIVVLGLILATLQILDGILTGIGVSFYGTEIEGNSIIRTLMDTIGAGAALVIVKMIALGVVALLCKMAVKVSWLPLAMKGVIALYLFAAIIPWSYILITQSV